MDNRAIGIFDSGIGGLTSLKTLRALLPEENFIFFADTGRMPYGGRSLESARSRAPRTRSSRPVRSRPSACCARPSGPWPP